MTKKQKKVLIRIIISAILVIAFSLIPVKNQYIRLVLFLIPYLIIGYDILKKAVLGIIHGQVFDENFLMALATVGAIILGEYLEGTAVMLFYQIGCRRQSHCRLRRADLWSRASRHGIVWGRHRRFPACCRSRWRGHPHAGVSGYRR